MTKSCRANPHAPLTPLPYSSEFKKQPPGYFFNLSLPLRAKGLHSMLLILVTQKTFKKIFQQSLVCKVVLCARSYQMLLICSRNLRSIAIMKCNLFSIITMPKKSHFTIFAIQNFVQNTKHARKFHLYNVCKDNVCKVKELCLVNCFHYEFRVSTQWYVIVASQNVKSFLTVTDF